MTPRPTDCRARHLVGAACLSALPLGVALLATSATALAADGSAAGPLVDRREIIVPARAAETVRIDNLLGRVVVRGSGRPGEIHVVAEKHAPSAEALGRLRVHYTAFESGEVAIDTRVELGGRERSLPLAGAGIDLWLEIPPDVALEAKTFGGDVSASGLRAGARLETTGGKIGVSDVRGGVVTRQLRGGQQVASVDGDVELDGVEGDMDLRALSGARVDAHLVDGSIRAEDIRSDLVRLVTTTGQIVLIGMLRPAAHYDVRSYTGDVRLVALGETPPFLLRARSAAPIGGNIPLRGTRREGEWLTAEHVTRARPERQRTALVEVSSILGQVRLEIQPRAAAGAP